MCVCVCVRPFERRLHVAGLRRLIVGGCTVSATGVLCRCCCCWCYVGFGTDRNRRQFDGSRGIGVALRGLIGIRTHGNVGKRLRVSRSRQSADRCRSGDGHYGRWRAELRRPPLRHRRQGVQHRELAGRLQDVNVRPCVEERPHAVNHTRLGLLQIAHRHAPGGVRRGGSRTHASTLHRMMLMLLVVVVMKVVLLVVVLLVVVVLLLLVVVVMYVRVLLVLVRRVLLVNKRRVVMEQLVMVMLLVVVVV